MAAGQGSLFRQVTVASLALGAMAREWAAAGPDGDANQSTSELVLVSVLLARESHRSIVPAPMEAVAQCLRQAGQGHWARFEQLPWHIVAGYLQQGAMRDEHREYLERLLGHHSSGVREWFHYVAWLDRDDPDVARVRRFLLHNIADKLWEVDLSVGLLAGMHPDKVVLDEAADDYEPDEFADQYQERLEQIRRNQWNASAFNLRLKENECRARIWQQVQASVVAEDV